VSSLEFDIINSADVGALRAGLKDPDPFVRSIAARALGIRGDKDSAEALAELVKTDPEGMVRVRAVESLGLLKMKPEVIELAKKDGTDAVQNPFTKEPSLVFGTALSDPAGYASALYGVSRKCLRGQAWVENDPCWFVIDRKGTLTYADPPNFSGATFYEKDIDRVFEELRKAAHE